MNRFLLLALAVLMSLTMVSCYTTFRAPHSADGADEAYDEPVQAIAAPLNPTIPQTLAGNYGWLYYYDSAWWMDEYENYENTGRGYAPEGYRQRFPNDPIYDPSVSGGYGGTVVAPALGKGAAENPDSSASQAPSNRRTFSTGNATNTQAGVNSTPPQQQDTTPRSSTTTTAPAAKPGGREQVKRK